MTVVSGILNGSERGRLLRGELMNRAHLDKLFTVLLAGVLAGLALAAAALPLALVFGLGFKGLMPYSELPESLRAPQPAQRSNLYANDGPP